MPEPQRPRLRTVDKTNPPYLLNQFPADFGYKVGREVIYLLATKSVPSLEGAEWEQIFAKAIGAEWKASNIGFDDIKLGAFAWGAKTVKNSRPETVKKVRLISGRNSLDFSYDVNNVRNEEPTKMGTFILQIWNERVSEVRSRFLQARTVVLIKGEGLLNLCVFEAETLLYLPEEYEWQWNENDNLEGYHRATGQHKFTWQPHGSQFTIKEDVPPNSLLISLMKPPMGDVDEYLANIGFEDSWIIVSHRKV